MIELAIDAEQTQTSMRGSNYDMHKGKDEGHGFGGKLNWANLQSLTSTYESIFKKS